MKENNHGVLIRLAVMDVWKPFRAVVHDKAPQTAVLFDKFHVLRHLGEALDNVCKSEYVQLSGKERRYIKGRKYTLLSHRESLDLDGRKTLKTLLVANKRLNTAYLLEESVGNSGAASARDGYGTSSRTRAPASSGNDWRLTRSLRR